MGLVCTQEHSHSHAHTLSHTHSQRDCLCHSAGLCLLLWIDVPLWDENDLLVSMATWYNVPWQLTTTSCKPNYSDYCSCIIVHNIITSKMGIFFIDGALHLGTETDEEVIQLIFSYTDSLARPTNKIVILRWPYDLIFSCVFLMRFIH